MAKDCLYCGLQFSDTAHFCPNCGRPTESGFSIRPIQEAELERRRGEVKEKDELIRQLALTRTMRGEASRAAVSSTDRRDHCDSDGRRVVRLPRFRRVREEKVAKRMQNWE
jgi:predicted  nucleic acid-binding Zn-ribbon protein